MQLLFVFALYFLFSIWCWQKSVCKTFPGVLVYIRFRFPHPGLWVKVKAVLQFRTQGPSSSWALNPGVTPLLHTPPHTHTHLDEFTFLCVWCPYTYVCINLLWLWPLQNVPWRMRHMRMEQRPKWSVTAVFVHVATGCVLQWSALVSKEYGHLMNPPRK